MDLHSLDRYQRINSHIHRLDARTKLVGTILLILSNALLPDGAWLAFGLVLALMTTLTLSARLGWSYTITRSLVALPFALAAVSLMFTLPGKMLTSFTLGPWLFSISDIGLIRFASILMRSMLSVQAAILLAATTPFHALTHGMRHLHLPGILIAIISFMYRYLFVLNEEALRLMRGRAARSAQAVGAHRQPFTWQAKVTGNMVGQLFLRSLERSDRVYHAMQARGFRGQFLTLIPHHMHTWDWAALGLLSAGLVIIQVIARL